MLVIGIAGGTGSGKTTVVKKIMGSLNANEVALVTQDSYYKDSGHLPLEERQKINFDHPDAIEFDLLTDHVAKLKSGVPVEEPVYSYLTCTRSDQTNTIEPRKVIIVEGILILGHQKLRDLFDIKVFVSADADDRLIRVINRDIIERGRTVDVVLERYHQSVKPMHLQFIEPTKRYADLIVPQGGHNKVAIDILTSIVKMNLEKEN
ncbi:MAG TPA: uridine kinase [Marinilabiliales bacterium]|jgi:uridine kinase|nr:MAG: uridine kinase [Bacteroidetes bacterium GWA2_40_14]OFX73935.1 MAG: uridine kinase [Bacteroidetes bacterium GWD2_40_43]OFX93231.1 MAG: uridine kinase [Bacteroidetes bacterium GWE2_40_63]OFY21601.1 MAG: uridine kinase [Bacteroidetes bacterium GWF2_40_13]OFZ24253.1 MAG: uridine kinase [Bacteroidetes bacterium RIFOXYC2_FULL_40_12]HAM97995.1 uridine kinase [Marinilabiliales bacterium]